MLLKPTGKTKAYVWPEGHPAAGEDIILRDYQVEAINNFLRSMPTELCNRLLLVQVRQLLQQHFLI